MANWIDNGSKRKLGLAPRDHLKTTVWTISNSVKRIANDANIRILLINEVATNAQHMLIRIRKVFENCEMFAWLFPELIPDFNKVRWTQSEMEVRRQNDYPEATIEAIGVGGASTSRHYNLIKEDDLVGKEASESEKIMQAAIDQHKLSESLLNCPDDEIQTYGTRWHPYDLTQWMYQNEPDIDHFCLSIFKPDGTPIWPTRFTSDHITSIRRKQGPAMFALQYENRAIAEGVTDLSPKWLRNWHWEGNQVVIERPEGEGGTLRYRLDELNIFEMVDPCISDSSGKSKSAVVVVGLTPDTPFNILILDATKKKVNPPQTLELAHDKWLRWKPLLCSIEVVGGQLTFFYWACARFQDMYMRKYMPSTHTKKVSKIRGICSSLGQQGRIYSHRDHQDFEEEWITFNPQSDQLDLLDAFCQGPDIWAPPEGGEEAKWIEEEDETLEIGNHQSGRSQITGY